MIQVINRALSILEFVAKDPKHDYLLSEIADENALNHGTCANILKTLVTRGYIEKAANKKGYKLGFMAYKLANNKNYNRDLLEISKPIMQSLCSEINETIILSIIRNGRRLLLHEEQCYHELQVHTQPESSVYKASTGRMMLAYYSPQELEEHIISVGLPAESEWPDIYSKEDLISALNTIRNNNIEFSCNKNHVVGLAKPIFHNNKIMASLGIYLPDMRFTKDNKKKIISELDNAAKAINDQTNS